MSARLGTLDDVDAGASRIARPVIPDFVLTGQTDADYTDLLADGGGSLTGSVGAGHYLRPARRQDAIRHVAAATRLGAYDLRNRIEPEPVR